MALEVCTNVLLIVNILLMFLVLVTGFIIYRLITRTFKGSPSSTSTRRPSLSQIFSSKEGYRLEETLPKEGYRMLCTKSFPPKCVEVQDYPDYE